MTFNKKLRLIQLTRQNGKGGFSETASRVIWANVKDIGVKTKFAAAAANREATLQAICYRKDFETAGYTHVDYNGHRYRIEDTGAADSVLHIKLILAKGG